MPGAAPCEGAVPAPNWSATMTRHVLIVLHQERSNPGRVAQELRRRGCELDIRRPSLGDPLPATMAGHDAAVIFGGPMSANDDLPFIKAETDWIGVPLKEGKPYLGICLGAQLMARHLGARVYGREDARVEVGYYPIRPTAEGGHLFDDPQYVYQWHREGFDLPSGAVQLAEGDDFPVQAMRYGDKAYGIQFHPELTSLMMNAWLTYAKERLSQPGAQPEHLHRMARYQHDGTLRQWLSRFIDHWLA
ncbi:glutamine amidotransferase [Parvibaculum sp.]|uniref:glutamine amidotransferase n=1 Tax=Parvibaculum sp. TaxID=2024848 RepID=UPI002730AE69|nr:glutamine amidotransferase [Parvibaculum sp.]MDP2148104.1 glutamine amidotransferase [Parvibaculum sp.]MDP3329356.1 glutamine amidotransferase [Parvibaculum sp.]